MTSENNSNKENPGNQNEGGEQPFSPSQYPGYNYPRPSSVQPSSNYPHPAPPTPLSKYPYPATPSPSNNPPPYSSPYNQAYRQAEPIQTEGQQTQLAALPIPQHRVIATYLILAAIVAMFIVTVVLDKRGQGLGFSGQFSGQTLLDLGALYTPAIRAGEWWRLITVMFLHANLIHILLNGINLYALGKQLEGIFGPVRYTVIFFLSGLSGSILSFGLHDITLAVGASGAIFGLIGALIGYFLRQRAQFGTFGRRYLQSLLGTVVINFALLFLIPGIDNIAHFGGLVGGFVLGYLLSPLYTFSQRPPHGQLVITQRDHTSYTWLFMALGWLIVNVGAFFFFLNR